MVTQDQNEGWGLTPKYLIGAAIGVAIFVICPEPARWQHGGAFAQSVPPIQQSPGNCSNNTIIGDNNKQNNDCSINYGPVERELTQVQGDTIASAVKGLNLMMTVVVFGDKEPQHYGRQIVGALTAGGANVWLRQIGGYPEFTDIGMYPYDYDPGPLVSAFSKADIPIKSLDVPPASSDPRNGIVLVTGRRP